MSEKTLYERLGGHDGIATFINNLMPRLQSDQQLGRFWQNRGQDGLAREKQILIEYWCAVTGGPTYYTGRDMKLCHKGMGISESDWSIFLQHAGDTMTALSVPAPECSEMVAFVESIKSDMVEL